MEAAASFFLGGANSIVLRSSGECSCGKMQDNCSIDPIDLPPTKLLQKRLRFNSKYEM